MPRKAHPTQSQINDFCELWERTRYAGFTELLLAEGWVATRPMTLRILTALKVDAPELAEDGGKWVVEPLMQFCKDRDPEIAERAAALLHALEREDTREELCRLVVDFNLSQARAIALAAGYAPKAPERRALFYYLTGQWEAYERLDLDHAWLAQAYAGADEALRKRITLVGREAGRLEWVTAAAGGRQSRRVEAMTEAEWETAREVLSARAAWPDMWRLAQVAPAVWAARLLVDLGRADWAPAGTEERAGFTALSALAIGLVDDLDGGLVRQTQALRGGEGVRRAAVASPDGRYLMAGTGDHVEVYGLASGQLIHRIETGRAHRQVLALSPDGATLAVGGVAGAVQLWSVATGEPLGRLNGHQGWIDSLAFGPDLLASGGYDKVLRVWSLSRGLPLGQLVGKTKAVDALAVRADGGLIASGSGANVQLWSWPDGRFLKSVRHPAGEVLALAFSPDGRRLASMGRGGGVTVWRVSDLKVECQLTQGGGAGWGMSGAGPRLAFAPDGLTLGLALADKRVGFFSLPEGRLLKAIATPGTPVVCPTADGLVVASGKTALVLDGPRVSRLIGAGGMDAETVAWAHGVLERPEWPEPEKRWLRFAVAFARWRKRFDIELGDGRAPLALAAFDILLED